MMNKKAQEGGMNWALIGIVIALVVLVFYVFFSGSIFKKTTDTTTTTTSAFSAEACKASSNLAKMTGSLQDTDNDEYADDCDNCIKCANSDQKDSDKDGLGDVCDPDDEKAGNWNEAQLKTERNKSCIA